MRGEENQKCPAGCDIAGGHLNFIIIRADQSGLCVRIQLKDGIMMGRRRSGRNVAVEVNFTTVMAQLIDGESKSDWGI